jgi:hypothetical protein
MHKNRVCAWLAALGIMAAAGDAFAAFPFVPIDCSAMPHNQLNTEFVTTHPGGQTGAIYQITGPCTGNFIITQDNITIEPLNVLMNSTIAGRVSIIGARNILLQDLTIDGSTAMSPPVAVVIVGPASVTIQSNTGTSAIKSATSDGVRADGPAQVTINTTTIQNNSSTGLRARTGAIVHISNGTFTSNASGGVVAQQGSTVTLDAGSIESSAAPNVPAITALQSSTVTMSATINTGPDNAPTILADQNSSISIATPGSIATSSASTAGPAIVARNSSSVTMLGGSVAGPSADNTIIAYQGSNVFLNGATITGNVPFDVNNAHGVLRAAAGSNLVLAGANDITNNVGTAVLVSGGSTFVENNGTPFGFTAAADLVTGDGRINSQSVIDLGAEAGGGGVDWMGNLVVNQFSSFRADGDNVTVTGTLTLDVAANGYFNHTKGASNMVNKLVCNSSTDHVQGLANVTLTITPTNCTGF